MSASKTQPSVPFTDEALQCNRVMNALYTGHTWESEQILPYVFQRLVAPDVPDTFVTDWAICITDRAMVLLNIEDNQEEGVKVETIIHLFIAACIRHGVIGTMLEVSRLRADKNGRSSYMALQCIAWLCKCTVASQDKFVRKDIASKDGFRELLERLIGGPKFAHRATAGHCFESLLNHTQMVEDLDIFDVSDLMLAAIEYNLRDYRHVLRELEDPETSYMKDIITYVDPATRKAALFRDALEKSVPTWFSNSQEITLSACILVTCRRGGLKRRDCLEILTRNPSIMDKLLTIVSSTRISSYLKDTSYSLAATVLCHLTKMNMSLDGNRDELDTSIKCNQLLYSQPYAVKGLVRAWNSVISESPRKIARSFTEQWKERMYPDMAWQCVQLLPHSRGMLRICILQLLSNLTLAAVAPHHLLLALLPIAYVACTRAPTELECAEAELRGDHLVDEHETEFRRVERHLVHVEHRGFERTGEEQPLKLLGPVTLFIPQETIMGPTLLFTLFRSLSTNGYTLRELRRMSKMPSDTPIIDDFPTPLDHIHQIVDKKVIGKLIRLTVHRRLGPLRESGRESLKSDPHLALEIYISAASLANAITDFALHPSNATAAGIEENMDSIRHAFQESVFATGNACEAAGRVGAWAQAKMFAELAIGLCDRYSVAEAAAIGWDLAASREKNIRRLEKSLQQLGQ